MNTFISQSVRVARRQPVAALQRSMFSTECAPARKIKTALESYREVHFSREIPSRFRKEVLLPYSTSNGTMIPIEHVNKLLSNIGQEQHTLSHQEQQVLLQEAGTWGNPSHENLIPTQKMMELLSN